MRSWHFPLLQSLSTTSLRLFYCFQYLVGIIYEIALLLFLFFCPYVLLPPLVLPSSSLHTLLPSHLPISLSWRGEQTHEEASKYVVKKLEKKGFFMVGLFCFHLCYTRKKTFSFFTQHPQLISVIVLDFVVSSEVKLWLMPWVFVVNCVNPLLSRSILESRRISPKRIQ